MGVQDPYYGTTQIIDHLGSGPAIADKYISNRESDYEKARQFAGQKGWDAARNFGQLVGSIPVTIAVSLDGRRNIVTEYLICDATSQRSAGRIAVCLW